ncbi:hypothetical protein PUNSTDRAFT_68401, partial [Punctularia strigosozonata HHB-11173 SS5]|uniref:uncharacterized protein n=1 Tax=Punctularia strigosozonata (strain HHB-11173) TaxID=741275 RepID=UPI00044173E9
MKRRRWGRYWRRCCWIAWSWSLKLRRSQQVCLPIVCSERVADHRVTGKTLGEHDIQLLKAYAYKIKHNLTDAAWDDIPAAFGMDVGSLARAQSRINFLAGFKPHRYDCCINSCMAFTGPREELNQCPHCKTSRYKGDDCTPRRRFSYLPLIPRLKSLYADPAMASKMRYRAEFKGEEGVVKDVFDGSVYQSLCDKKVVLDEHELPYRFFSDDHDVALGFSTDGFSPFRERKNLKTC